MVNNANPVEEGTAFIKGKVEDAIEDFEDKKLEDGTFLRGNVRTVNMFKRNSPSFKDTQVRLDNEQQANRIGGPYFKIVLQGCKNGKSVIKKSVGARGGKTGTQYATVLVHHSFNKSALPPADVFRACLRSSSARCDEMADEHNKVAFVMTVVLHPNGSWVNEYTGEVGNVPAGAEPPKTEAQMIKDAEDAKAKEEAEKKKKKGKGKQPKNSKFH